jgi:hypothetical protein
MCVAGAAGVGNVYDVINNPVFQCLSYTIYIQSACVTLFSLYLKTFMLFFLICCLFNDTVSDLDYLAPNYVRQMTVNEATGPR